MHHAHLHSRDRHPHAPAHVAQAVAVASVQPPRADHRRSLGESPPVGNLQTNGLVEVVQMVRQAAAAGDDHARHTDALEHLGVHQLPGEHVQRPRDGGHDAREHRSNQIRGRQREAQVHAVDHAHRPHVRRPRRQQEGGDHRPRLWRRRQARHHPAVQRAKHQGHGDQRVGSDDAEIGLERRHVGVTLSDAAAVDKVRGGAFVRVPWGQQGQSAPARLGLGHRPQALHLANQVVVRQHHSLGRPRGAAGVDHGGQVTWLHGVRRARVCGGGGGDGVPRGVLRDRAEHRALFQHLLEGEHGAVEGLGRGGVRGVPPEDDNHAQVGPRLRGHALGDGGEYGCRVHDHRSDVGVRGYVRKLLHWRLGPSHRVGGAAHEDTAVCDDPARGRLREKRDSLGRKHPFGRQSAREVSHVRLQLCVRVTRRGFLVRIFDGYEMRGVVAQGQRAPHIGHGGEGQELERLLGVAVVGLDVVGDVRGVEELVRAPLSFACLLLQQVVHVAAHTAPERRRARRRETRGQLAGDARRPQPTTAPDPGESASHRPVRYAGHGDCGSRHIRARGRERSHASAPDDHLTEGIGRNRHPNSRRG
mmetsp:Transcript_2431/g.3816  ORF Transcript_2431/g.3816 Transcript_2431/m.3816 type:complete len:587 (-) Transcript_2431:59-1819(-)